MQPEIPVELNWVRAKLITQRFLRGSPKVITMDLWVWNIGRTVHPKKACAKSLIGFVVSTSQLGFAKESSIGKWNVVCVLFVVGMMLNQDLHSQSYSELFSESTELESPNSFETAKALVIRIGYGTPVGIFGSCRTSACWHGALGSD